MQVHDAIIQLLSVTLKRSIAIGVHLVLLHPILLNRMISIGQAMRNLQDFLLSLQYLLHVILLLQFQLVQPRHGLNFLLHVHMVDVTHVAVICDVVRDAAFAIGAHLG